MNQTPQKTGPIEDLKGMAQAWWSIRGSVWFWVVGFLVVLVAITSVTGPLLA
jgi:hypothetical protein